MPRGVAPWEGSPALQEGGGPAEAATQENLLDLLQSRIADYQATVLRCRARDLPDSLSQRLFSRGVQRLVVPSGLPDPWIPKGLSSGVSVLTDGDPILISTADLACADAVVTGCALAVAETGTIALDGGVGQGRRAISLLPDFHLCVVKRSQIVGSVPEGIARLRLSQGPKPGPITLISGPSATSDIELIRVEGVHGPRILDVILVEDQ
jgi:L-lactate dehydrogenase complex protein LldG